MVLPDIQGSNATVNIGQIAQANGKFGTGTARWIQFVVSGSETVRVGNDPDVSASIGIPVGGPFGSQFAPPISQGNSPPPYPLNGWYAYIPAGATLSVMFEPYN